MIEFFTELPSYSFLQYALLSGLLASVACGIIGTFTVVRRSTYVAGAISHCVLGGMGAARYFQRVNGIEWFTPLLGAVIAAVTAALLIGWITIYAQERIDTVLSAIWALGMALGVLFIAATPGYNQDLMSFLFGNILMVSREDLVLMAILNGIIVITVGLLFNKLLAISFNEELAATRGIRVGLYTQILLVLTALTVVLLVQIVGIVLVIALLTLPAATASLLTRRFVPMTGIAVALCALMTVGGLSLSYGPELPAGAMIIVVAGALYVVALAVRNGFRHFLVKGKRAQKSRPS